MRSKMLYEVLGRVNASGVAADHEATRRPGAIGHALLQRRCYVVSGAALTHSLIFLTRKQRQFLGAYSILDRLFNIVESIGMLCT